MAFWSMFSVHDGTMTTWRRWKAKFMKIISARPTNTCLICLYDTTLCHGIFRETIKNGFPSISSVIVCRQKKSTGTFSQVHEWWFRANTHSPKTFEKPQDKFGIIFCYTNNVQEVFDCGKRKDCPYTTFKLDEIRIVPKTSHRGAR